MAIGDHDVLARASRELRAMPERGWPAVERRVIDAVRTTPRSGWPVAVVDPHPGQAPGHIEVSDLVVRATLARALRSFANVKLIDIAVTVEDKALRGVRIEVSGRYGSDLSATAERARAQAVAVILEVIGDAGGVAIDVVVTDVHR